MTLVNQSGIYFPDSPAGFGVVGYGGVASEFGILVDDVYIAVKNDGKFFYGTNHGTGGIVIDEALGNVGIGTNAPAYTFDVFGDSAASNFYVNDGQGITAKTTSNGVTGLFLDGTESNENLSLSVADVTGLYINNLGNVGVGTTTPTRALTVVGTVFASNLLGGATTLSTDANGNIIRSPSDQSLKENITTIENALDKISQLRGVSYEWLDKARFGSSTEIGVIAQEVEQVVPEVVSSGGEYKSVKIANLVGLIIEAVKELKTRVDTIASWFSGDSLRVKGDICVDDICVTKEQFKQMLQREGGYIAPQQNPTPAPTPEPIPTTTEDESDTVEPVIIETEPEPAPEPAPEIAPEPSAI
jgi:hypothetical protein